MLERGAVERMQHGMAGAIGGRTGPLSGALPIMGGHAAERPLINFAVFGAREWYAPVFKFVNRRGGVAAEIFDRVLIAEPIRPLDGVAHVPPPVILAHIAQCRGNAALRRDRVRAGREYLADTGGSPARPPAPH